jgi:7-dehydrocholesterol reductase
MPVKKDPVASPYSLRPRSRPSTPSKSTVSAKIFEKPEENIEKSWGRAHSIGWLTVLACFLLLALCPIFVIYVWSSCTNFNCEILTPAQTILQNLSLGTLKAFAPAPTIKGFGIFFGWLGFQALLYVVLPGKIGYGQRTPAGHLLPYVVNGLLAWFVTHALFIGVSLQTGWYKLSIIHDYWGPLLVAANVYGYGLAIFSYVKAHYFPSHPNDRKFSGSIIYDFFMGIEFNPRFGKYFDFKLFHNGRPGIVAWTLINFSFAAAQYNEIGYVTNSMLLLNWLHLVYVLDFFYNEDWYLRTIDIAHDHFGFYLAWGDSVWLPYM